MDKETLNNMLLDLMDDVQAAVIAEGTLKQEVVNEILSVHTARFNQVIDLK